MWRSVAESGMQQQRRAAAGSENRSGRWRQAAAANDIKAAAGMAAAPSSSSKTAWRVTRSISVAVAQHNNISMAAATRRNGMAENHAGTLHGIM